MRRFIGAALAAAGIVGTAFVLAPQASADSPWDRGSSHASTPANDLAADADSQ
jgi:hypothetical protein